ICIVYIVFFGSYVEYLFVFLCFYVMCSTYCVLCFYVLCLLYAPSHQKKFQVGVNLLGNKSHSDSDSDSDSENTEGWREMVIMFKQLSLKRKHTTRAHTSHTIHTIRNTHTHAYSPYMLAPIKVTEHTSDGNWYSILYITSN